MITLNEAAEIVKEFNDIGLAIAGETPGLHVIGNTDYVGVRLQYIIWDGEKAIESKEQVNAAVISELDRYATYLQEVVKKAKKYNLEKEVVEKQLPAHLRPAKEEDAPDGYILCSECKGQKFVGRDGESCVCAKWSKHVGYMLKKKSK